MAELAVPIALALIDKVIIILQYKFQRHTRVQDDVVKAHKWLKRMEAHVADSSEQIDEGRASSTHQTRVREIQDLVYKIEDALDEFMLHIPHHIHSNVVSHTTHKVVHYLPIRKAGKKLSMEIGLIEKEFSSSMTLDGLHNQAPADSRPSSSAGSTRHVHDHVLEEAEIVGFEEHEDKILAQLMEANSSLVTISIVGPPGSGKTTLANKVFDKKLVQGFFDCQAWVYVPRSFVRDDVLLNILSKIEAKGKKEPVTHEENNLVAKLRQLLEGKRFLIVLDNVWNRPILQHVVGALQHGLNGSRIIITTSKSDVASFSSERHVHDLSPGLPWEKAEYLFCKKVFQQGTCPDELKDWAQKILKKCEGLPHAISAVGTHLSTKQKIPVEWKNFHNSLGSEIGPESNLSVISRILQPSYKDLPTDLKPCFLYFSIFPEDYSIGRQKLIRLWMAEGLVKDKRGMTVEQVAEGYLNELVARNLVQTSAREVDGRVRNCRVLNLVRDFIISKAENCITVLNQTDSGTSGVPREKIRRLSIHNGDIKLLESGNKLDQNRILLLFQQQSSPSVLEKLVERSRYLRVLDLQGVSFENFPNSVLALTLLRYLSLRKTNIKTVPGSIKNLALLETLDLKHTQVTTLPIEIYELHNMRHLLVYRYDVKNYVKFGDAQGVEVSQSMFSAANIGALSSIQKLSLMKVKNNRKLITALVRLTGLRKLGLTDLETRDGRDMCLAIQKMEHLSTLDVRSTSVDEYLDLDHMQSGSPHSPVYLERLYLKGRLHRLPRWIPQLKSLQKIGLKWSKLNANPLEILQALPNLLQLELVDYYTGEELEFKTETFKKLKILHIEQFEGLNTMVIESGAMPMLEKLTMCKCPNLKLLPAFGPDDLKSLEELLLYDMNKEFIGKLQNVCEDRLGYKHVRVIHSFSLGSNHSFTGFKNLSPSQWRVEH